MTVEKAREWMTQAYEWLDNTVGVGEAMELLNQALAELPEPASDDRDRTHWTECWREPGHHGCCVARVERLEAELAECRAVIESARDSVSAIHHDDINELRRRYTLLMHVDDSLAQDLKECRENCAELDCAVDALIEERDQYDADVERCREALTAAEERERKLKGILEGIANTWGEPGDAMNVERLTRLALEILEEADSAALDAALERARAEGERRGYFEGLLKGAAEERERQARIEDEGGMY